MIRLRVETPSTSYPLPSSTPPLGTPPLLPIPLPNSSPPLLLPYTIYRTSVFEVTFPPRKRFCIALCSRYEIGESSSAPTARPSGGFRADYRFVATLDDEIRRDPERDVGYGITNTWDEMLMGESTKDYCIGTADGDCSLTNGRPRSTGTTCKDTETDEYNADTGDSTSESVGTVADALAVRDAERSMNGNDSHNSGTDVRRQAPPAHECTYPDFMKCKPLYSKGTEGVIELTQWFKRMET
ncbi:hypothetical protein Tco_1357209, partial [Tanacetum coccineum]